MNHIEEVMNTVKKALGEYEKIDAELKQARAKLQAEEIGTKACADLESALNAARSEIRAKAWKSLSDINTEYRETVEKSSEVDASMLHEDAKILEIPGLELTQRQFTALVEKHKGNPLMMQAMSGYQKKHPGLYADHLPSPENRIADFNSYVGAAVNAVNNPTGMQAAFFLDGHYTPGGMKIAHTAGEE